MASWSDKRRSARASFCLAACVLLPQFLNHPGGGHRITSVRIDGTVEQQPSTFSLVRPARIQTRTASEPLLEIYIAGATKQSRTDLRPALPIVVVRNQ